MCLHSICNIQTILLSGGDAMGESIGEETEGNTDGGEIGGVD